VHNIFEKFQIICLTVLAILSVLFGVLFVGYYFDDTCYHIVAAVRIAQHLNPWYVNSPVDSHWFPAGASTLVALLVLITGSLNSTNLSGSLCFIVLLWLTYRFAGIWSRDRTHRLLAVTLVGIIPLLLGQCLAFYSDIHITLVLVGSLHLMCLSLVHRKSSYAHYGLAAGLLTASIKYSGLLFAAILLPAYIFCLWKSSKPRCPNRIQILVISIVLVFAASWYVRNLLARGNPVYPFGLPAFAQELVKGLDLQYEADPEHVLNSPQARFPHPWIPQAIILHRYTPDMTDDGFGFGFLISIACVFVSLTTIRRLDEKRRTAWIFLLVVSGTIVASTPLGRSVPRYLLFAPVIAALGPSVLSSTIRSQLGRVLMNVLCVSITLYAAAYLLVNFIATSSSPWNVGVMTSRMMPYRPIGIRDFDYVKKGHLKIGYTSGFNNFIARLYDPNLTNTLVPLHYKNYPYNYGKEFSSEDEFLAHVRSLNLDYIHIFDPNSPGTDLLKAAFPDRIRH
jgi:hypothetical protein